MNQLSSQKIVPCPDCDGTGTMIRVTTTPPGHADITDRSRCPTCLGGGKVYASVEPESDPAGKECHDDVVETDALLRGDGGQPLVQGGGESDDELSAGFHGADSTTSSIDMTSTACDTRRMSTTEETVQIGQTFTGQRHPGQALADRPCICGCQHVVGEAGVVTEILPRLDDGAQYVYVTFSEMELHRPITVAYYDWEVAS